MNPNSDEPLVGHDDRPTAKQLAYLRSLADRAGQTFCYPRTRRQASEEVRRLRGEQPTGRVERRIERREIADAIADGPADAARVDVDREVTGFGSTATCAERKHAMTTATVTEPRRQHQPIVGSRVELARYTISSGERVVCGQRVDGVVRVTDRPLEPPGRSYLIERGLEQDGNAALQALVADYVLCGHPHKRYYADPLVMPITG